MDLKYIVGADDEIEHDPCVVKNDSVVFVLFLMSDNLLQSLNFVRLKHQRQDQLKKCFLGREHFNDDIKAMVIEQ